jgi:hypothetical protein
MYIIPIFFDHKPESGALAICSQLGYERVVQRDGEWRCMKETVADLTPHKAQP